jgi:hypothetical protein
MKQAVEEDNAKAIRPREHPCITHRFLATAVQHKHKRSQIMVTEQYRQHTLTICVAAVIILLPVSVLPVKATYRKEPQKF